MLSRSLRFPLRSNQNIFRQSKRLLGQDLDIFVTPSSKPQAAIIVGKNVSLKAAERNHIKRILGEILAKDILPSASKTLIVRAKTGARTKTYAQLKTELIDLVAKN